MGGRRGRGGTKGEGREQGRRGQGRMKARKQGEEGEAGGMEQCTLVCILRHEAVNAWIRSVQETREVNE